MTEVEKRIAKRKKELACNIIYTIIVAIIMYFILSTMFFSGHYEPDPSLMINYDLSKDVIPDPKQKAIEPDYVYTNKYTVDIKIKKLATYDITGKVEGIKDFSTNFLSNFFSLDAGEVTKYISPRDLALSWGDIALDENSNSIQADQYFHNSQRVVQWAWSSRLQKKYPSEYIRTHISNNHIITLDPGLTKQLKKIKVTDVVRIIGYLVDVDASNGYHWGPSSLVRNDTGCEIILAEDIIIMPK